MGCMSGAPPIPMPSGASITIDADCDLNISYIVGAGGTITINNAILRVDGNNSLTIDGTADIASGGSLRNRNNSTITVGSTGVINNDGNITNRNTFVNNGTINNNGIIDNGNGSGDVFTNNGTLNNNSGGQINNDDDGDITNDGTITNDATITNDGTITNNMGGLIDNNSIVNNNSGATITNDGDLEGTGGTFNNDGTFNNNGSGQLPITLTSFTGKRVGSVIHLVWETASEENNDYMEVQRSRAGKRFEPLGRVPGQGTTATPRRYAFTDEQPLPGVNYYRLKQVDYDGAYAYHHTIAVLFTDKQTEQKVTLFPAIVTDQLNISLQQEATSDGALVIYNLTGQEVLRLPFQRGLQQQNVNVAHLAEGQYVLRVQHGREVMTSRFVKQ